MESIRWPQGKPPLILGPCVGMHNEEPGLGFAFTRAFLKRTLGAGTLDAVVMHSYNNDGGDDWERPGFLVSTTACKQTLGVRWEGGGGAAAGMGSGRTKAPSRRGVVSNG